MTTESHQHLAWIALGSNIQPEVHLPQAVTELAQLGRVAKKSSVWESAPVGDVNQPRFCNAAVWLWTSLDPRQLRGELRRIEVDLGRRRDPLNKNAARTIDLDVAIYDDVAINDGELRIPDPEISQRPFLAIPLAELDGNYRHPDWTESLDDIATRLGTGSLTLRDDIRLPITPAGTH